MADGPGGVSRGDRGQPLIVMRVDVAPERVLCGNDIHSSYQSDSIGHR